MSTKTVVIGFIVVAGMAVFFGAVSRPTTNKKPVSVATEQGQSPVVPITPTGDVVVKEEKVAPTALQVGEKKISTKTSYQNPSGSDEVGFTVTVDKDGVITDVVVDILATNLTSKMRQQAFAQELPQVLKGKKLHDLEAIDQVGGSSLTTRAFNEILPGLKSQL